MPTIDISKSDFEFLFGKKFSLQELSDALLFVKAEIDSVDGDILKVDVKETLRPDLWSVEGIVRELKARLGFEKGFPKYVVNKPCLSVVIEKSVKGVRPFTVGAVLKGVVVTEPLLVQLIQLQEKMHLTYGKKRSEVAIGVYDFDKIVGDIRYYGAVPSEKKFVPLDFDSELYLDEILEVHPKGREFGYLLKGKPLYPIFEDSKGNVLSMPPIINSNYSGKVTLETKNLFVEVSGFSLDALVPALNVIVMALADRGAKIYGVNIVDSNGQSFVTPFFETKSISLSLSYFEKISGLKLSLSEVIDLLERSRYVVSKTKDKDVLSVSFLNYRVDLLHQVDVVEDLLVSYDYNKISPLRPSVPVFGSELKESLVVGKVREICVGLGLQEVLTFVLTSKEKQSSLILSNDVELVEIANPVSSNWAVLRKNIFPELLEFLSKNKSVELPHKIFEIGKTLEIDSLSDSKTIEKTKVCLVVASKGVGFTEAKSMLVALARELNRSVSFSECSLPWLKRGKSALCVSGLKGFFGELADRVCANFGLSMPIIIVEVEF
ncbi:MAG: phenylalanine--tRNA ligase subunit beta [Candidatus Diapherotrites archaeon]